MITSRHPAVSWRIAAVALVLWFVPTPVGGQAAPRAIVLAWDGTVPAFAHEMLRAGKLPHLAKLIEGGAFADDVVAVFPSKTAPGFAALITGAPPNVTGISGNRVPRAPRDQFTILESLPGFSATPLRAESIWAAARRAGKKSVVSHIPTFAGELAEDTVRFSGYTLIAGRDGIVTKNKAQSTAAGPWRNSPPSVALPIEISFNIGESKFSGLLIDDPADDQAGYDTLILATARDGDTIKVRLKAAPPGVGGELFWSQPIAIKTAGNRDAKSYFRLFDLKPDGSDFFLYYTRPVRDLPINFHSDVVASPTVRTFVGNGATILFQQGALGRTIPNGGNGGAEARYLETLAFAQHQLTETHRWAIENLPWDLFLAYTPFPDEAEHLWRGHLDTTLSSYRQDLAERVRPLLERAYRSSDDLLGLLLSKRPANSLVALISDHGLQGINKRVTLNQVLRQEGLLVLDAQGRVDLTKTKVLYPAVNNGYLLINSKDRKNGIVGSDERAEVIRKTRAILLALRDGEQQIVKAVYDSETDGAAMGIGGEVGGDIYIELASGYDFDPRIAAGALVSETPPYGNHGASPEQTAMHTLMVFNGPGIRAGQKLTNVRIIDFAPTLAWLLNLPKLKDATGRVLFEATAEPRCEDNQRATSMPCEKEN
ncbi:MAG: alkaline phosphatase family protein [Candidatus Binatia bacterium]